MGLTLATQAPPRGNRVGIVTNAGGPAILCADACEAEGLAVPLLPVDVRASLAEFLPPQASRANPVDMIASASAEDYRRTIEVLGGSGAVDALIVIFIPPLVTRAEDVTRAVRAAVNALGGAVPVVSVFMQAAGVPQELRGDGVRIPSYAFPEDAARALARAAEYGTWRSRPEGALPSLEDVGRDEAAGLVAAALLDPAEIATLLACYGLPLAKWRLAGAPEEAGRAAEELGGTVALKAVAPALVHKTEVGGVRLSLSGHPGRRGDGPGRDPGRPRGGAVPRPAHGAAGGGDAGGGGP